MTKTVRAHILKLLGHVMLMHFNRYIDRKPLPSTMQTVLVGAVCGIERAAEARRRIRVS